MKLSLKQKNAVLVAFGHQPMKPKQSRVGLGLAVIMLIMASVAQAEVNRSPAIVLDDEIKAPTAQTQQGQQEPKQQSNQTENINN
jgi:hypothetical protein